MRLFRRGEQASTLDLLVAGLGNPGREYERTGTTSGWMVVDELARRHGGSFRSKFSGQLPEVRLDGLRLALLKPETYMNDPGKSISAARRFFKVEPESLLVVHDDVDLEAGPPAGAGWWRARRPQRAALDRLRARDAGLPAAASRSRAPRPRRPATGGRLRAFAVSPDEDVDALISRAADAVETIARDGVEAAQQRFN